METNKALSPEDLYRRCDPDDFSFETTAELEELKGFIGQDRAVDAIQFGIGVDREGYNLFALGPPGTGRHTLVREFLAQRAADEPTPADWCYVNNFEHPHKPRALKLPAGRGCELRDAVHNLIEELHTAIPATFESEDYRTRRQAIEEEFKERQGHIFEEIQERAQSQGIALIRTPGGFAFAPMREGEVVSADDFQKLPEEERERLQETIQKLEKRLQKAMQGMPKIARQSRSMVRELDREVALFAVGSLIDDLIETYKELEEVADYLKEVRKDIIENVELFRPTPDQASTDGPATTHGRQPGATPALRRYGVNPLVDHSGSQGAPVVFEEHPTYQNLLGRVEHLAEMGTLVTDFNLIKPGGLHRANGGYLVLDARKVLTQPHAWEGLKQALKSRQIRIESLGQMYGAVSTVSLEPEPIPLDVKVILIGERTLYYMLQSQDSEFDEIFRVAVDFNDRMERSPENDRLFAQLLGTVARREGLKPLHKTAVARTVEQSARLAGDSEKLSARIRGAADLVREADYWAGQAGKSTIDADDIQCAIDGQIRRAGRIREQMQEDILRGTILIDTEGAKSGQINGLSVIQVGDTPFGRPSRITARLRLGSGKVIDIEREVELGGPLHSKGVLILSSFLAARYAVDRPLSLSASLVFEQSYGGIDGDSASSAELYALLSALADAPIKQCFAVTGSVNQHGYVQAIGGVNEKIEGFFDICHARGLDGEHGVLIPASNVRHLMLRRDVVEAVSQGQFRVYPVETIDQGIEILTGMPAGERGATGAFAEGTVNHRVEARLIEFADKRRAFGSGPKEEGES